MVLIGLEGVCRDGTTLEAGHGVRAVGDDGVDDDLAVDARIIGEHPAEVAADFQKAGAVYELLVGDDAVQHEAETELRVGRALGEVDQTVV